MKNNSFKSLLVAILFIILGTIFNYTSIDASWNINVKNETFTIHNDIPGKLYYDNLVHGLGSNCKNIIVSGNINDYDLGSIDRFTINYNSINIYETDINEIKTSRFCYKCNLKKFVCPKNLKSIGRGCFFNCPNLEQVVMSNSLEIINDGSFQFCPELQLVLPSSVNIGRMVFNKCPYVDSSKCGKLSILEKTNYENNKVENTSFISNIWTSLTKTLFN